MPLKLAGALLLSLAGLAAGCALVRRLRLRKRFLRDFIAFLTALETNLRWRCDDIFTLVNSSQELFALPADSSSPFEQVWEKYTAPLSRRFCLKREDALLLGELGAGLGKTDAEGQLAHLALYKTLFCKQLAAAEEELQSKAKLYRTLGLFAGMSAALMMI